MHMSVAQAYAILEHSSVVELPAYIRRVPGSIPGVPIFQNGGIAMISEFVEYVKQVWKNKPNVSSPLNADRLNHMESGIENNSKKIKETVTAVNELTENSGHKPNFSTNFLSNAWNTIHLNSHENALLVGHLVGNNNAIEDFFCYLISAGADESNTGKYYKIAGNYEPELNWNNGHSIGIHASYGVWMQYSVLHI